MSTEDLNFKRNGRNKVRNGSAHVEVKNESIENASVEHSKTVRAKTTGDSVGDTVRKVQEQAMYADIVLKGKKGKQ